MKTKLFCIAILLMFISSSVKSQELSIFNGLFGLRFYQDDIKISRKEAKALIYSDKEAQRIWKKSNRHYAYSLVTIGAQVGILIWFRNNYNDENFTKAVVSSLATSAVGLGFSWSSNNLKKKSALEYNKNQEVGSVILGPTYNGLGLLVSF